MKKSKLILILALLTCLSVVAPARAGDVFGSTYSATMQSAAAATGNGTAMDCGGLATIGYVVSGTFVATVTFEGTVDGVNWASLLAYNVTDGTTSATATAAGTYVCNSAGLSRVRARVSAYTSGTVTVTARGTVAHTNALAFSSGGAAGPDFSVTGANAILGTADSHYTSIRTNGVERINIPADGATVSFQDALLVDVGTPLNDYDAANKIYADSVIPLFAPVGLRIASNATTPNTKVDFSIRQAVLTNGTAQKAFTGSGTIDTASVGANGLDAGTQAANTLYYLWLIGKADGTFAGLLSTSSTAPTMPTGYTFKFLASWVVSDASTHFLGFIQDGNIWTLNDCQSIYDTNPAPVNTETTVNVNTHNTYPLCPVELTRRVGVGVQTGGSGGNRSIALYRGDALGSGPTEASFLQHENVSAYCGWVGLDSSAQIKFIIHPGAPNDRILIRAFAFQVEWY